MVTAYWMDLGPIEELLWARAAKSWDQEVPKWRRLPRRPLALCYIPVAELTPHRSPYPRKDRNRSVRFPWDDPLQSDGSKPYPGSSPLTGYAAVWQCVPGFFLPVDIPIIGNINEKGGIRVESV